MRKLIATHLTIDNIHISKYSDCINITWTSKLYNTFCLILFVEEWHNYFVNNQLLKLVTITSRSKY